jgi:hypothetical protein
MSGENYEFLFDIPVSEETQEKAFASIRSKNITRYRTKTIKSGKILECEIYPIWNTGVEMKKAKEATTREAQRKQNEKNARKNLTRKINANFDEGDLCITLTYKETPVTEEQARKDIRNYMRRIRDHRKKNAMPELKYIYVMEHNQIGQEKKRIHHHIVMSGMDRDEAERLWGKGWANTRRLQPDDFGLEALSKYITKDPYGSKRWVCSKNLDKPQITIADTKISKRKATQMAIDFDISAPAILSKHYPDYEFNSCRIHYSDYVSGAYIYINMRKKPKKQEKKKLRNTG